VSKGNYLSSALKRNNQITVLNGLIYRLAVYISKDQV
jgi:hypothetical protein